MNRNALRTEFLKHLRQLVLRPSPTGKEEAVRRYAARVLGWGFGWGCQRDRIGNLMWQRGEPPHVLLCAHMDTVQRPSDEAYIREHPGVVDWSSGQAVVGGNDDVQMGFDDKVGIALILALAKTTDLPFRALLTAREESGQRGVREACAEWLHVHFSITLDRRGRHEIVGRIADKALAPQWFLDGLLSLSSATEWTVVEGRAADTYYLADYTHAVNLSVGYSYPHDCGDSCNVETALDAAMLVAEAIGALDLSGISEEVTSG